MKIEIDRGALAALVAAGCDVTNGDGGRVFVTGHSRMKRGELLKLIRITHRALGLEVPTREKVWRVGTMITVGSTPVCLRGLPFDIAHRVLELAKTDGMTVTMLPGYGRLPDTDRVLATLARAALKIPPVKRPQWLSSIMAACYLDRGYRAYRMTADYNARQGARTAVRGALGIE